MKYRAECIQNLRDQITLLETGMQELVSNNNSKHLERSKAMADLDTKVLELFDRKLQNLQAGPLVPPPAQVAAIASLQATPPTPAIPLATLAELEEAKKLIAELQRKLKEGADKVQAEFDRAFADVLPHHLPAAQVPAEEHLPAVGALYLALQSWAASGAAVPFDWGAMRPIMGDNLEICVIAKQLLGPIWDKWYQVEAPTPATVVPRQVAMLLLHCLSEIKNAFETNDTDAVSKAATEGLESMKDSAKRLRVT